MNEVLAIGDVEVKVRRSEKRHTVALTVERDGSVVAAVPKSLALGELSRVVRSREVWLHSALSRREAALPSLGVKEYVYGEGFHYLGRKYRLRVLRCSDNGDQRPELQLSQGRFHLRGDCVGRGRECFVSWYSAQAEAWLTQRLPALQRRVGVEARQVAVMNLGFRWASCSHAGRINFHWRTILLPPVVVTYLVLHELCHLLEHSHTPRFWSLVGRVDRDFQQRERWLKENGGRFVL